jgi:hypothetical protein
MNVVRLIPVFVSVVLAAAHFLRVGNWALVLLSLAVPAALALRRPWAARLVQAALALMALEWVRTLLGIIAERQRQERSWTVAAVILLSVAAFTAGAALVFLLRPLKARYRLGGPDAAP